MAKDFIKAKLVLETLPDSSNISTISAGAEHVDDDDARIGKAYQVNYVD